MLRDLLHERLRVLLLVVVAFSGGDFIFQYQARVLHFLLEVLEPHLALHLAAFLPQRDQLFDVFQNFEVDEVLVVDGVDLVAEGLGELVEGEFLQFGENELFDLVLNKGWGTL